MLLQHLFQLVAVEADDDFLADDDGGGHAAPVYLHQVLERLVIARHVQLLEIRAFGQEILSQCAAGRSGGLHVHEDLAG